MGNVVIRRLMAAVFLTGSMVLGLLAPASPVGAVPLPGGISGTVVSEPGGTPIDGATVTAYDESFNDVSTTTVADGTYAIGDLPDGTYTVEFAAAGHQGEWWDDKQWWESPDEVTVAGGEVTGIDAGLVALGTISGTVTDPMGDPLEGVDVSASGPGYGYTTTAADGTYTLEVVPGSYSVWFGAPAMSGLLDEWWQDAHFSSDATLVVVSSGGATAGIDAMLDPGVPVSGTVLDPMGDPVTFADIYANTIPGNQGAGSTTTGVDGMYTIFLPPGSYAISASDWGSGSPMQWYDGVYSYEEATPVAAVDPGTPVTGIDFALEEGASISGTVTDPMGDPIPDLEVNVFPVGSNNPITGGYTDAMGDWTTWDPLPPGSFDVRFGSMWEDTFAREWYDDSYTRSGAMPVVIASGVDATGIDAELDFVSAVAGVLEGTVSGPGGPVSSAQVSLYDPFDTYSYSQFSGYTQPDGTYSVTGVPPGDWHVLADPAAPLAPQYFDGAYTKADADTVSVPANGTGTANFSLETGGSISGTVVDPQGDPVTDAWVYAFGAVGNAYTNYAFTAADGTYTIEGLAPGDHTVCFDPSDESGLLEECFDDVHGGPATPVPVTLGADTPGIDAQLEEGGSIAGTVLDELGDPVEGAWVSAWCAGCGGVRSGYGSDSTEADGTYQINGLDPTTYTVGIDPPDGVLLLGKNYPGTVTVEVGETTGGIDFELSPSGGISGTVVRPDGDPLSNVWVEVTNGSDWFYDSTDVNGQYAIGGLTEDSWEVSFDPPFDSIYVGECYDDVALPCDAPAPTPVMTTIGSFTADIDAELAVNPDFDVPGPPVGVGAVPGNGEATVSWTAPLDDGGVGVDSYEVTASPGGATAQVDGFNTSAVVGGLTNGVAYTFTVTATNEVGTGPASDPSDPVTPVGPPGAPTDVTAVAGDGAATVSWTAPASDGGSPITLYNVTSDPPGGTCSTSETMCEVTGLTNGTEYTFTATASNAAGAGPDSAPSNAVTPLGLPGAPADVTGIAGNELVVVSWTPPAFDGGSPITGYEVTADPGGATCTTAGDTMCTVGGLTNGTAYTFTVAATNAIGTGPASLPSAPVTPEDLPGPPTGVSAVAGNMLAVVSWTAPVDTGGGPITGYEVTADPGGGMCTTTGDTSCTVTGLTNGTAYTFTVTASNVVGEGPPSAPSAPVTPEADTTVPGAPTGVSGVAGDAEVMVSWTAPADDGGSPITGYEVTAEPGGATCTTTGDTSCTVMGLTNGTAYTFTVTATNAVGEGPASAASDPVTPVAGGGSDCGPAPAPGPFPDVAGTHIFCGDIEWLADGGITGGFEDGTFRPAANITRGSMAAFLYRYAGSPEFTPPAEPTFPDVPTTHVFYKEIEWAAAEGITTGATDGTFKPAASITRGSMAAFFYRMAGEPEFTPPAEPSFPDVGTGHPFFAEIEWLVEVGVTEGFDDGTYRPASPVTRGGFAAFLHRFDTLGLGA